VIRYHADSDSEDYSDEYDEDREGPEIELWRKRIKRISVGDKEHSFEIKGLGTEQEE
jgi:hypothetical protein